VLGCACGGSRGCGVEDVRLCTLFAMSEVSEQQRSRLVVNQMAERE